MKRIKALSMHDVTYSGISGEIHSELIPLATLCKEYNKFGMYVHFKNPEQPFEEFLKAAPYLANAENSHVLVNGFGYFLFDHEDDLRYAFDLTIGEKGPNVWNDYTGPAKVYAYICNNKGEQLDENT
jgi:hypothetical protein